MYTTPNEIEELVQEHRRLHQVARADTGPRTGRCLAHDPQAGAYCFKFQNPDPQAAWDFWWILTYFMDVSSRLTISTTNRIPLPNGELILTHTEVDKAEIERSVYIREIEQSSTSFGLVRLDRLKVKELYRQTRETLFRREVRFVHLSPEWEILDLKTGTHEEMPDLPGAEPEDRLFLYFPTYEPVRDEAGRIVDYDVDGGVEVESGAAGAPAQAGELPRRPGLYVAVATQEGALKLYEEITYVADDGGRIHFLQKTTCTGVTHIEIVERIRRETKSSWFKSKTKISLVRKVIRLVDGWDCETQNFPPRPGAVATGEV